MTASRNTLVVLARTGYTAKGIVYILMGGFLVDAAVEMSHRKAKSWADALRIIHQQPFGWLLLGTLSIGLILYGIYQLAKGRCRRIC